MKFGRNYRIIIEANTDNELIIIEPPFTIAFNVKRSTLGTLNTMQLSIYNLKPSTRDQIFQDRFNPGNYKRIILQAGYDQLSTIFIGNIFQANSERNGSDIITSIDARDGGFDTGGTLSNLTIDTGSVQDVVRALANDFENVTAGTIAGDTETQFRKPVVLNGNTFSLIKKYTKNKAFIDLEQVNYLSDDEVVEGVLPVINSETGMLGTPKRDNAYLTIKTLFEPRIVMGQLLEVQSSTAPVYDGQYKVIGVTHSGVISDSIGGNCESTFELLIGSQLFGGFNKV